MENLTAHPCSSDSAAVPAQLDAAHVVVQPKPRACLRCAPVQSVEVVVPVTVITLDTLSSDAQIVAEQAAEVTSASVSNEAAMCNANGDVETVRARHQYTEEDISFLLRHGTRRELVDAGLIEWHPPPKEDWFGEDGYDDFSD
jgi:hypothetical protein